MNSYRRLPMTLGSEAAAKLRRRRQRLAIAGGSSLQPLGRRALVRLAHVFLPLIAEFFVLAGEWARESRLKVIDGDNPRSVDGEARASLKRPALWRMRTNSATGRNSLGGRRAIRLRVVEKRIGF